MQGLHLRVNCNLPRRSHKSRGLIGVLWLLCSLKDEEDKPAVSDKDLSQMVSSCGNVRSGKALITDKPAVSDIIVRSYSASRAMPSVVDHARSSADRRSSPEWKA